MVSKNTLKALIVQGSWKEEIIKIFNLLATHPSSQSLTMFFSPSFHLYKDQKEGLQGYETSIKISAGTGIWSSGIEPCG